MAHFVPYFVAMATGVNINDTVKLANPENHTLEPKLWLYLIHSWSYDGL